MKALASCLFLILVTLFACGSGIIGSTVMQSPPNTPPANIAGSWKFAVVSSVFPNVASQNGTIYLTQNGAQITTVRGAFSSPCIGRAEINGSVNGNVVTASLANSSTDDVTFTVDGDKLSGNYVVSGVCQQSDRGSIIGIRIPPLTGNWTGAWKTYSPATQAQLNGTLNTDSSGVITGSFTVIGSSCFSKLSASGTQVGDYAQISLTDANGATIALFGVENTAGSAIGGDAQFKATKNSCPNGIGTIGLGKM